jgi:hypothetical protein
VPCASSRPTAQDLNLLALLEAVSHPCDDQKPLTEKAREPEKPEPEAAHARERQQLPPTALPGGGDKPLHPPVPPSAPGSAQTRLHHRRCALGVADMQISEQQPPGQTPSKTPSPGGGRSPLRRSPLSLVGGLLAGAGSGRGGAGGASPSPLDPAKCGARRTTSRSPTPDTPQFGTPTPGSCRGGVGADDGAARSSERPGSRPMISHRPRLEQPAEGDRSALEAQAQASPPARKGRRGLALPSAVALAASPPGSGGGAGTSLSLIHFERSPCLSPSGGGSLSPSCFASRLLDGTSVEMHTLDSLCYTMSTTRAD